MEDSLGVTEAAPLDTEHMTSLEELSCPQDFLNPYLGQVFRLMGFERQEFVFIQGTSVRSRENLASFTQKRALGAAETLNRDICDTFRD